MRTLILATLFVVSGCSTIRSAVPLSPAVTDPRLGVWVYIESTRASDTGVYRCWDPGQGGKPVCEKANW